MSENKNAIGTEKLAWSSHIGFLLACVGAAIGLGNIWKFPYMAGTQGGGAFVLIYLVTILLIAIPVAAAELITGRMARRNAVDSVIYLARDTKSPALFGVAGLIAVLASFMLLTFYPVISGWVMAYLSKSLLGGLSGYEADRVATEFKDLNISVKPKKGSLLVWKNILPGTTKLHPDSLHAGRPVTKGEKYAFNLWFRENKFV